jgi:hypothetical protein
VMEAESLNSLAEHDFQAEFKKWQKRWKRWWEWWPVGPKSVFDQMAAPAPEIMDDSYSNKQGGARVTLDIYSEVACSKSLPGCHLL